MRAQKSFSGDSRKRILRLVPGTLDGKTACSATCMPHWDAIFVRAIEARMPRANNRRAP
jgi:hypothetical protein